MRLKGINVFEQHAEKIALAVFGVFAVVIFVLQFGLFGTRNTVDVGQERQVPPDRIASVVQQQAERLRGRMDAPLEENEIPSIPSYEETVLAYLRKPAVPSGATRIALAPSWSGVSTVVVTADDARPTMGDDERYLVPEIPAPGRPIVAQHASTVDPFVPAQVPLAAEYLPSDQPYDKRFVSVQVPFDRADLLRRLSVVPDDDEIRPLPSSWWQGTVEMLDVEFVRQRLMPDGTWGPEEVVSPLPGRFSLRDRLASTDERRPGELRDVLALEATNRAQIRRPRPYRTISGPAWEWPGLVEERRSSLGDIDDITRLVNDRKRMLNQIELIERRIRERRERDERRRESERERGGGGGGGAPGGGGRSDGGERTWPGDWPDVPRNWYAQMGGEMPTETDTSAEDRQIADLRRRIAEIEDRLAAMGLDPEGAPLVSDDVPMFSEQLESLTARGGPEQITLWAHDLGVEAGGTYRYKARVRVTNPFFGRERLPESQRSLSESIAMESAASDWSDPIRVYEDRAMFVTGGSPAVLLLAGQGSRNATANVEMYEFFYGYWRRAQTELSPGDLVAGSAAMPVSELPRFTVERTAEGQWRVTGRETMLESKEIEIPAVLVDVVNTATGNELLAYLGWLADGRIGAWRVGSVEDGFFGFEVRTSAAGGLTAVVREPNPSEDTDRRRPTGPIGGAGGEGPGADEDGSAPFIPPSRRERGGSSREDPGQPDREW
ncbi:MAG: hypothetical protein EA380_07750 [Phycisphaeraceae bacterium]|nr:MAG: hypothetical protein EA380_07750 [Phycisphaeraceae bacterium]